MHELPYLNGEELHDPLSDKEAAAYCEAVERMLFETGRPDVEQLYSKKVVLLGFLLYTNAHVEFIQFLVKKFAWEFLNAVSGRYFHIFSIHLQPEQSGLSDAQQQAMLALFDAFQLGEAPIEPHLVLASFEVEHEIDSRDFSRITYRGHLHEYAAFQLGGEEGRDYLAILRQALYPVAMALAGMPVKPLKTATRAIKRAHLRNLFRLTLRDLFKSEMTAKFAGAWRLLNWRPGRVD